MRSWSSAARQLSRREDPNPACLFARLSLLGSAGCTQVIFLGFRAFSSGSAPGAPGSGACPAGSGAFPGAGISACSSPTPCSTWLVIPGHSISGGGVLCGPAGGSLLPERAQQKLKDRRCTARLCRPPAPAEHIVLGAKLDSSPSLSAKQAISRRADPCLSTR